MTSSKNVQITKECIDSIVENAWLLHEMKLLIPTKSKYRIFDKNAMSYFNPETKEWSTDGGEFIREYSGEYVPISYHLVREGDGLDGHIFWFELGYGESGLEWRLPFLMKNSSKNNLGNITLKEIDKGTYELTDIRSVFNDYPGNVKGLDVYFYLNSMTNFTKNGHLLEAMRLVIDKSQDYNPSEFMKKNTIEFLDDFFSKEKELSDDLLGNLNKVLYIMHLHLSGSLTFTHMSNAQSAHIPKMISLGYKDLAAIIIKNITKLPEHMDMSSRKFDEFSGLPATILRHGYKIINSLDILDEMHWIYKENEGYDGFFDFIEYLNNADKDNLLSILKEVRSEMNENKCSLSDIIRKLTKEVMNV